jgi:hypothetical protein
VAAVEPQLAVAVLDHKDAAVADRVGDGFHCDAEPLAARLVLVGEPQSGTDFGWAELQAQLAVLCGGSLFCWGGAGSVWSRG